METQSVVAVIGLSVGLLAHATVFGVVAGKLFNRVEHVEKDNNNLGASIKVVDIKVDEIQTDSFNYFTSRESCKEKMSGILKERALYNQMNSQEHKGLAKSIEAQTIILQSIQECVHKMQAGKECD